MDPCCCRDDRQNHGDNEVVRGIIPAKERMTAGL
jgi:hypothetical protein